MDLVQNNPVKGLASGDRRRSHKNNNLLIRGNQVRANGGDNIMIDNISGTVTKI